MKNYLLIILGLMLMGSSANANSRFSIVGGINYGLESISSSLITVEGGLGFGGGVLIGLGSVELGALYLSKTYNSEILGVKLSTSAQSIHIPVLYRFGSLTSFGVGGFYELGMCTGGGSNYGLSAGPRFAMTNGFFLDLRFNYGLATGNSKDALALVGYAFK